MRTPGTANAAARLAGAIRELRRAAGLSQQQLAGQIGYTRQYVSLAERVGRNLPSLDLVRALDRRLDAGGTLLVLRDQAKAEQSDRRRAVSASQAMLPVVPGSSAEPADDEAPASTCSLDGLVDVLGPSDTIATAAKYTLDIIGRYELEGPQRLAPELRSLRRLSQRLGERTATTAERAALTRLSAQQAALLAYMSVNLSRFADADRFALEAALLATALDDSSMLAWIRGTQSFSAYYRKDYGEALALAQAGARIAGGNQQRVRLLSNGVARAAGKLGDRKTVDRALGDAFEMVSTPGAPADMTSCIDLAPYGWARTAANAATAYLSVGDYGRVLELTQELRQIVANSDSDWSRSLVQLDEATAIANGAEADLEHAAAIGLEALEASASKPIASVRSRAQELALNLQRRGSSRVGLHLVEAIRELQTPTTETGR